MRSARGLREVCALGFVENTRRGQSGNGEFRTPNLFRLTYLPAYGKAPTHKWREIETIAEAEKIASEARRPIKNRVQKNNFPMGENAPHSGGNPHCHQWGTPPLRPRFPSGGNPHYYLDSLAISPAAGLRQDHQPTKRATGVPSARNGGAL